MWRAMRPQRAAVVEHAASGAADVVIVGAGLTGLSTAVQLARLGRTPLVVEAHVAGAGTTGHTTAKVSLLQGDRLQRIRDHASAQAVRGYVEANRVGQASLVDLLQRHGAGAETRLALTYAITDRGATKARREAEVAREAGLEIIDDPAHDLPFPVTAAIGLADQVQVDPMAVIDALRAELAELGGLLTEGVRVTGVSKGQPWTVETSAGEIRAEAVVLATQTPIDVRGTGQVALSQSTRSYAIAYDLPPGVDDRTFPMALSLDPASRSLRTATGPDGPVLLVGGGGHDVGEASSTREKVEELDAWARDSFGVGEPRWSWSAQDYGLSTAMPFVGALPGGGGTLLAATGYDKWGMAMGAAAGLVLAGDLTGDTPEYAEAMRGDGIGWCDVASSATQVAKTVGRIVRDRVRSSGGDDDVPAEGEGWVQDGPLAPTAVSTVDGRTCRVSAVCTHLGGILAWNDVEGTWDCPLHGSRFTHDGIRVEGPATADLDSAG